MLTTFPFDEVSSASKIRSTRKSPLRVQLEQFSQLEAEKPRIRLHPGPGLFRVLIHMHIPHRNEKKAAEWGYTLNEEGTVLLYKGRQMAVSINRSGYKKFTFGPTGKRGHIHIHRLQAWFSFGEAMYEYGMICRHLDGNPLNNHKANIALGTHSQNTRDQDMDKVRARAFAASRSFLKHDHAAIIAHYKEHGWTATERRFGIASGTLNSIINHTASATRLTAEEKAEVNRQAYARRLGPRTKK